MIVCVHGYGFRITNGGDNMVSTVFEINLLFWASLGCIHFFFFFFLYRRSSAIMSWSSTHVLFWIIEPPSVGGSPQCPFLVCAAYRVRTHAGATQTTSANALTTSATSTPNLETVRPGIFLCTSLTYSYNNCVKKRAQIGRTSPKIVRPAAECTLNFEHC